MATQPTGGKLKNISAATTAYMPGTIHKVSSFSGRILLKPRIRSAMTTTMIPIVIA